MAQTSPELEPGGALVETPPTTTSQDLHESTEAAEHGSSGLPQFEFGYWPGQIFWLLIVFVILYVILSKLFLPRVGGAIEARAAKIEDDLADARGARDEAERQSAEAAAELAQARARAQKTAAEAKAAAKAEADSRNAAEEAKLNIRLAEADAAIAAGRDRAMANVRTVAAETAEAIVEKLSGQAPSRAEVDAAIARNAA
jgi:F-type H+-transporting ATPase subunit b